LGCKICVGRDFFRLIFSRKKVNFFLQNPKKRTRYIHEIFAVFQNNFRILSNVFASSKSQILVKGGFFAAVFFLPFFGCCWSQNSIIHHGQGRCVFDFGVEFFQVGFDWLISFCS
jgi:hypothetical protein